MKELFSQDSSVIFEAIFEYFGKNLSLFKLSFITLLNLEVVNLYDATGFLLVLISRPKSEEMILGTIVIEAILKIYNVSKKTKEKAELRKNIEIFSKNWISKAIPVFQINVRDYLLQI